MGKFYMGLGLAMLISWPINLYKLTNCDFTSPYKCEAVHGFGLFPLAAVVTVWFDMPEPAKVGP